MSWLINLSYNGAAEIGVHTSGNIFKSGDN